MNDSDGSRTDRFFVSIVVGIGLVAAICTLSAMPIATELFASWQPFLFRVLPQVNIDWGGVGVFVAGFVVAALCLHSTATWLVDNRNRAKGFSDATGKSGTKAPLRWSPRATASVLAAVMCVFVIGIAMAGVVHQVGWIINSSDGITIPKSQKLADASLSAYDATSTPTGMSWITACAPYVPFQLERKLEAEKPFDAPENADNFKRVLPVSICPSLGNPLFSPDGFGLAHVAANPDALGQQLRDLDSTAFLLGEVNAGFEPRGSPTNHRNPSLGVRASWEGAKRGSIGCGSLHPGGANACLIEGSVRFISQDIDSIVLQQLARARLDK